MMAVLIQPLLLTFKEILGHTLLNFVEIIKAEILRTGFYQQEINYLHCAKNLPQLGGFSQDGYWSSTEYDNDGWELDFSSTNAGYFGASKFSTASVRAIRAF